LFSWLKISILGAGGEAGKKVTQTPISYKALPDGIELIVRCHIRHFLIRG